MPKLTLTWILLGRALLGRTLEEGVSMVAVDAAEFCDRADDIDDDSNEDIVKKETLA